MKHYRISIEIDITATAEQQAEQQAEQRALLLYSDLERRPWIEEVLPNGMLERRTIPSGKGDSA